MDVGGPSACSSRVEMVLCGLRSFKPRARTSMNTVRRTTLWVSEHTAVKHSPEGTECSVFQSDQFWSPSQGSLPRLSLLTSPYKGPEKRKSNQRGLLADDFRAHMGRFVSGLRLDGESSDIIITLCPQIKCLPSEACGSEAGRTPVSSGFRGGGRESLKQAD